MSNPSELKPGMRGFAHLFIAAIAFGIGWWLWQLAIVGDDLQASKFLALMFGLGGLIRLGKALGVLLNITMQRLEFRRYGKRGKKQKTDQLVDHKALRKKGLIK